jgi:Domain of unknown function (DUF5615)
MSRFIADENFPGVAVRRLRAAGRDIEWVRETHAGISDEMVWDLAVAQQRTILTLDKDFGELAFRRGLPSSCGIVLFRLPMAPPRIGIDRIVAVIQARSDWSGHFGWSNRDERGNVVWQRRQRFEAFNLPAVLKGFRRVSLTRACVTRSTYHRPSSRVFGIPIGTLRDWEQHRAEPDQAARSYLAVIAADPGAVRKALEVAWGASSMWAKSVRL